MFEKLKVGEPSPHMQLLNRADADAMREEELEAIADVVRSISAILTFIARTGIEGEKPALLVENALSSKRVRSILGELGELELDINADLPRVSLRDEYEAYVYARLYPGDVLYLAGFRDFFRTSTLSLGCCGSHLEVHSEGFATNAVTVLPALPGSYKVYIDYLRENMLIEKARRLFEAISNELGGEEPRPYSDLVVLEASMDDLLVEDEYLLDWRNLPVRTENASTIIYGILEESRGPPRSVKLRRSYVALPASLRRRVVMMEESGLLRVIVGEPEASITVIPEEELPHLAQRAAEYIRDSYRDLRVSYKLSPWEGVLLHVGDLITVKLAVDEPQTGLESEVPVSLDLLGVEVAIHARYAMNTVSVADKKERIRDALEAVRELLLYLSPESTRII